MLSNSFANLAWYRHTKDLVPLFDPTVHLFEIILLKILDSCHVKITLFLLNLKLRLILYKINQNNQTISLEFSN